MNRIYLIGNDGRLWFGEKTSSTFELLELDDSQNGNVLIKRLSSCDWCLWLISSKFDVYLYVFKLDTPFEYQEVSYQNQRRYNFLSSNFSNKLLPSDRSNYSSKNGELNLPLDSFKLPTNSWVWKTDWIVENDSNNEGWEYAVDFPSLTYYQKIFSYACVRRRKWYRNRSFTVYNKLISIPAPSDNDCIITDISIGGWMMPFCEKNYLSVWIISNSGNLYFRKDVSCSNLEGRKWAKVILPTDKLALNCCCSCKGDLWVVTYDGDVLMRKGISRENPTGNEWIFVDSPSNETSIKQIGLGNDSIWTLDNYGKIFYRIGITASLPQGKKWVHVKTNLTNISISSSNNLWGINWDDSRLYFRAGIDPESGEIGGTEWKKVLLKCKKYTSIQSEIDNLSLDAYQDRMTKSLDSLNFNLLTENNQKEEEIVEEKPQQPIMYYIDEDLSIYDSENKENNPAFDNNNINQNNNFDKIEPKNINSSDKNSINVNLYTKANNFENIKTELVETDEGLDNFILKYQLKDMETESTNNEYSVTQKIKTNDSNPLIKSRSSTQTSNFSSNDDISISISNSNIQNSEKSSLKSFESNAMLIDVDFKYCNASSFHIESSLYNWFDSDEVLMEDRINFKNLSKLSKWRIDILNDLKKRNLKEFSNIDKISVPYENDLSWSRKDEFYIQGEDKSFAKCLMEIVYYNSRRLDDLKNKNKKNSTNLKISVFNKKRKVLWEKVIDFKTIICVTRYVLSKKESTPCFAIFVHGRNFPYIFLTSSDNKLNEWTNQIAIYCHKLSGKNSLQNASTFVNSIGLAYFSYFNIYKPYFMNQIDGSFKLVEKHYNGITLGLGDNGRLWVLKCFNNSALECYKGPYIQTDELEYFTYENQRWNAISGVMGLRNGFTIINFPTDRYLWSDETGTVRLRKDDFKLPCSLYNWSSNWQIDYSTPNGVDKDGWQYAFDFPMSYHPVRTITDYVRRRRWRRTCKITTTGLWEEINQKHCLTSISFDQQILNKRALLMATDSDGFVLSSMIDESSISSFKWMHVPSDEKFIYISIGVNYRIWTIDFNGNVYFRIGSNESNPTGNSWELIKFSEIENVKENLDTKFKMISVGNDCVWAISQKDELFFRENVTKYFPQGTSWTKIDSFIKFVTVNYKNEVFVITTDKATKPGCLLYRDNVSPSNLKGIRWVECINMKCRSFSNRGNLGLI